MAFNGILADLAALAAVDISDPKGDGSVSLPIGFFLQVQSPGDNTQAPAWFTLRNEPDIATDIHNWAIIANGRSGDEVWINSSGITAPNNTPPSLNLPNGYKGTEWKSKYIYPAIPGGDAPEIVERWTFGGTSWYYHPSVIVYDDYSGDPPEAMPLGRGQMVYADAHVFIANYDLGGWTLLVETGGSTN